MYSKLSLALSLYLIMSGSLLIPSNAEGGGKFPGKGDYLKWQEANWAFDQGNVYFNSGAYDKAIDRYKAAIAIYPDDHAYFNCLGLAYKKKGDYTNAQEALQKAIALNSKVWDAWSNLGSVLKRIGKTAEAREAYMKALQLGPPANSKILLQQNIAALGMRLNKPNSAPPANASSTTPAATNQSNTAPAQTVSPSAASGK